MVSILLILVILISETSMDYFLVHGMKYRVRYSRVKIKYLKEVNGKGVIAYNSINNNTRGWGVDYHLVFSYIYIINNITNIELGISGFIVVKDTVLINNTSPYRNIIPLNDTIIIKYYFFLNNTLNPYIETTILGRPPYDYIPIGPGKGFAIEKPVIDPFKSINVSVIVGLISYNHTYVNGNHTILHIILPPPIRYLSPPMMKEYLSPIYLLSAILVIYVARKYILSKM